MTSGCSSKADGAAQFAREGIDSQDHAERFRGAAYFLTQCPAAYLDERDLERPGQSQFVIDC